jgi:hypothetical protein
VSAAHRRACVPALLVSLVALPGLAGAEDASARGVFESDSVNVAPAEGVPITVVSVDNRLGDVRVEGHDGDNLAISAVKRAPDMATLDRLKVQLVPDPKGPIRIGTVLAAGDEMRPIAAGSVRVDLVIHAPRSARVEAQVWNGQLELVAMENGASLSANEGDIKIERCSGDIDTTSAFGSQDLDDVFGAVEARGVRGDVRMRVIRGDRLDAAVHEGTIIGRKVRSRHVSIRTTRGNIEIQGEALIGGRYELRTHSGDIVVHISGAALAVRARSDEGAVDLPAALRASQDAEGVMVGKLHRGKNPALIELHSRLGDIRFQLAE